MPNQQCVRLVKRRMHAGPGRCVSFPVTFAMRYRALSANQRPVLPTAAPMAMILQVGGVWLRPCYSEGSEPKREALVEDVEMEMSIDYRLLDDQAPTIIATIGNAFLMSSRNHWILDATSHTTRTDNTERPRILRTYAVGGIASAPSELVEILNGPDGVPHPPYTRFGRHSASANGRPRFGRHNDMEKIR